MIDITPVDVRKKKGDFRRIMRGYDPALVDDFLDLVADRLEELVRENLALAERTGRQDQQVAEYRDRERALTEALLTAQQMREEIRQQTTREAEATRHAAESETSQLRATVTLEMEALRAAAEQEVRELREAARRESQDLRAAAERETQELRTAAQREAEEMRAATQRDEAQLRTKVKREREREEEEFRRLRQRQEQFLVSYRTFLERELKELGTFARAVGLAGAAAAAAAAEVEPQTAEVQPVQPNAATPEASGSAGLSLVDDDFAAPGDDPDLADLAFAEPVEAYDDVGITDALEPFEPEPIEPEDLTAPGFAPLAVNEVDALLGTLSAEPEDPRPIDLGPHGWAAPPEWNLPNIDVTEPSSNKINFGADEKPPAANDDEGDEDTTLLLRNAEAAGYRVDDLDNEGDELLLDEELPADKQKDDDGWLPSLLEDGDK